MTLEELESRLLDKTITKQERKALMKKIYKKKNPEKVKLWKKINKDKYKDRYKSKRAILLREWKDKNKEKVRNDKRKRKELQKQSPLDPKIVHWESEWRKKTVTCTYCLEQLNGADAHMDHIIPLSKFGKHEMFNLCISCPTCNLRKSNKNPFNFIKLIEDENFHKKNSSLSNVTNLLQDFLKDEYGSVV